MDDRELLRKNYEDACNAYLRAFCQKHGYDEDDAVNSWAAGDVGGIASVGDEFVNMDTIIADIDMQAPETAFGERNLSNVFLSKRHVAILGVASGVLHGTTLILGTPG
jgi:hypothetical protein